MDDICKIKYKFSEISVWTGNIAYQRKFDADLRVVASVFDLFMFLVINIIVFMTEKGKRAKVLPGPGVMLDIEVRLLFCFVDDVVQRVHSSCPLLTKRL